MQINIKSTFFLLFAFSSCSIFGQFTDQVNSNRPGESMSAFSVGKTIFQTEIGLYKVKENHKLLEYEASGFGTDIALRYGYFREQFEFITNIQYQNDKYISDFEEMNRNGFKKLVFGGKYLFYDPNKNYKEKINVYSWKKNHSFKWHQMIPALSGYVGMNMDFQNSPYNYQLKGGVSPKVMLISQNQFNGGHVFVINFFFDKITTTNKSYGYVMTYTRGINEHWSAFVENKAIQSNYYSDGIFTTGAAYLFDKSMQIDASLSSNYKDTPSLFYAGLGFSWRFDKNYKEVKMKIKNGKEDKKSKKDKKAKIPVEEVPVEKPSKE